MLGWPPCSSGSLPPALFFSSKELTRPSAKEARCISNSCSLKICKIGKSWEGCSSSGYTSGAHPGPFLSEGFLNSSGAVEQSFTLRPFSMPYTSPQMQITYAPTHCFTFKTTHLLQISPAHSLYSCCKFI